MSEYMETIRHSMNQTTECQDMLRGLIKNCKLLIERVECLEIENKELKKELDKKC